MHDKKNSERRFAPAQFRVAPDAPRRIEGYALKFNEPSTRAGNFTEVIRPGSVSFSDDVCCYFDHDTGKLLGRTSSGTLQLTIDETGLFFSCDVPDTTVGRDTVELVSRRDIIGCSFGFWEIEEQWQNTSDGPLRELTRIEVFEVSPCIDPAYPSTEIAVRSKELWEKEQALSDYRRRLLRLHEKWRPAS